MQHKPILTTSTSIEFLHKSREHNFYKLHHNRSKRQTFDEIEATGNLDGLKTTDFGSCRFMPLMSSWSAEQIDNGLKCCNTMDPTGKLKI